MVRDHEAWRKIKFASEDELQRFKNKVLSGADDPDGAYSLFFDEETRRATQNQIEKEMIKRRRVKLAKMKGIKLDPSEFIDEKE